MSLSAWVWVCVYTLVELLSPTLNHKLIEQALKSETESYEL